MLADGNRIVTKSATRIFRDGEGRTRREQLNAAGTDVMSVNISDPVAGTTYVLDPASRIAYRNGAVFTTPTGFAMATVSPARGRDGHDRCARPKAGVVVAGREVERNEALEGQSARREQGQPPERATAESGRVSGPVAWGQWRARSRAAPSMERWPRSPGRRPARSSGSRLSKALWPWARRSTTEIPAGAIGNEQPIRIVSEQWFSPDLQVLVLTRHTDPRVGETTYRLLGIVRAEPVRSLFDLPADYTLQESAIRRQER